MNKGRTLKVFLVDGTPTGLLTAEIMNWTGHVITGPRSRLTELIQRPEATRTAVYFLVGPDQGAGIGTQVYIGETDDAGRRLAQHNKPEDKGGKDFWERVCVVTSKDANLTKGHIKYLESRLIETAKAAGRCELLNGTDPGYAGLPEADRSDMEYFVEQIQTLLPVLGYDFLRQTQRPVTQHTALSSTAAAAAPVIEGQEEAPVFVGTLKKYDIVARGQEINGEFVVFKGSKARSAWEGAPTSYTGLFAELVKSGVLIPTQDDRQCEFSRDYAFASPSAAASVVTGRSTNGRTYWVSETTRMTYSEWQDNKVRKALGRPSVSDELLAELDAAPSVQAGTTP